MNFSSVLVHSPVFRRAGLLALSRSQVPGAELDSRTFGSAEAQTGPLRGDTGYNSSFFSAFSQKSRICNSCYGGSVIWGLRVLSCKWQNDKWQLYKICVRREYIHRILGSSLDLQAAWRACLSLRPCSPVWLVSEAVADTGHWQGLGTAGPCALPSLRHACCSRLPWASGSEFQALVRASS